MATVQELVDQNPTARGLAVIITNDYENCPKEQSLPGCHIDGDEMKTTFVDVHKFASYREKNLTTQQMIDIFAQTAQCKFPASYKYISVVYSGHGEKGALIANDRLAVSVKEQIIGPFEPGNSPRNKHIVKLFFIDACRGGLEMVRAKPKGLVGPERGNYLIAYSTTEGYVSWAFAGRGSQWMVPLAKKLRELKRSVQDIVSIVTGELEKTEEYPQAPRTVIACDVVELFDGSWDSSKSATAAVHSLDQILYGMRFNFFKKEFGLHYVHVCVFPKLGKQIIRDYQLLYIRLS